jgi:general secretion pathway protein J
MNTIENMHGRRSAKGFTLLEAIVVMVITSLISVVLIQGLGMVLNLRGTFGDKMVGLDQNLIRRSMVTSPLEGLLGDFDDGEFIFRGNSQQIVGLTLRPLTRRSGRPQPFILEIAYDDSTRMNSLVYREARDQPIILAQWEGDLALFRYIGDDRGWLDQWPDNAPTFNPGNVITDVRPPQLPELIYLQTNSLTEADFSVVVMGRRNRVPRDPPLMGS